MNIDEEIAQWNRHRNEMYVKYRTIYSTHPHHLWRIEELQAAARVFGLNRPISAATSTVNPSV